VGGVYITYGRNETDTYKILVGKPEGRDHLGGDLRMNGRIFFKRILKSGRVDSYG
jgi:hypothetical protein